MIWQIEFGSAVTTTRAQADDAGYRQELDMPPLEQDGSRLRYGVATETTAPSPGAQG